MALTVRTALLPVLDAVRGMMGNKLDLRLAQVTIITRTWPGLIGQGTPSDSPLVLMPNPLVVQMSAPEVSSSGGRFQTGDLKVGPITPPYGWPQPGGYSEAQLRPTPTSPSVEIIYTIVGPNAGQYSLVELEIRPNLHYIMTLRRRRSTP